MSDDAAQILLRMKAAYAGCRSYADEGVVSTTFFGPQRRTERRPFSTRFLRPDGFLFEFRSRRGEDHWDQYAVWMDDGQPRSWWTLEPGRDAPATLGHALAGATGVSAGSAHRVPHLLMPDLNENREGPSVITATIITTPEAASQNCVVVERPRRMGSVEQMWIDSSSYLIRRVVEPRHTLGLPPPDAIEVLKAAHPEHAETVARAFAQLAKQEPVEVESITTYQGAFDVDVTMEELRFIPSVE